MTGAERAQLIAQATEQAYQDLYRLEAEQLAELERLYQQVLHKIEAKLPEFSSEGYFNAAYYQAYLKALRVQMNELREARQSLLTECLLVASVIAIAPALVLTTIPSVVKVAIDQSLHLVSSYKMGLSIDVQLISKLKKTFRSAGINPQVADQVINVVEQSVADIWDKQLADNLKLSDRIWRLDQMTKEALSASIRQALANGDNPLKAARAFLEKGEGLPADILQQLQALNTGNLQQAIQERFLTGKGSALYNAQRVFQTEMTRAHGLALVGSTQQTKGLVGYRFRLSPFHRRVDICDALATADRYGLGAGVYPADKIMAIHPAHPNTRSYIVPVYD